MRFAYAVSAAAILFASASAQADPFKGGYVGGAVGRVTSNVVSKAYSSYTADSLERKDKRKTGYKVYGGYSFGYVGVEGGYYDLGTYRYSGYFSGSYSSDKFASKAVGLFLTGNHALSESFGLHGKLGAARVTTRYTCSNLCTNFPDNSESSIKPALGIGVSWQPVKHFAVKLDFETIRGARYQYGPASLKANYDMLSLGAEVRI
ncbi:outer membrane beta-barrel protein [Viridibacterium curvum]|uniref:Outer membrane protein beta-barrel domain-containing protein n=1 Tax=Viridibacterium curvum TaxID=1101404 RepID=A0ABP9QJZ8_9RHOO